MSSTGNSSNFGIVEFSKLSKEKFSRNFDPSSNLLGKYSEELEM